MRKNHKKMRGQHKTADFSNVEILLIEDGAKDASGALCDSFAGEDARIRVLHKKNAGVSAARNSGMDMAQGTYIQFTDSDDYLPEDYLERLMQTQKSTGRMPLCGAASAWWTGRMKP